MYKMKIRVSAHSIIALFAHKYPTLPMLSFCFSNLMKSLENLDICGFVNENYIEIFVDITDIFISENFAELAICDIYKCICIIFDSRKLCVERQPLEVDLVMQHAMQILWQQS